MGSDREFFKHQTKMRNSEQALLKKHGYKDVADAVKAINKATDKKPDVRPTSAIKKFTKALLKHGIHADVVNAVEELMYAKNPNLADSNAMIALFEKLVVLVKTHMTEIIL